MHSSFTRHLRFVLLACMCAARLLAAAPAPSSEALKNLEAGQARFVAGTPAHPRQDTARRTEVASGQKPLATVLTCSDSRVPPEILFDQGIGDLFVIRVAGNIARPDEIGSAEYGAGHLGAPLLVVLGHSSCGAVKAVVEGTELHGSLPQLVEPITTAVGKTKATHANLAGAPLLAKAIEANVWHTIEQLLSQSSLLRDLVKTGKLQIVGAVYDLASGSVQIKGEHPEQAGLLATAPPTPHSSQVHDATPAATHLDKPATAPSHDAPAAVVHATSLSLITLLASAFILGLLLYGANRFSRTGMNSWTIGARLTAGFSVILVVLTALSVESYQSMHTALLDFTEYRADARHSVLAGEIQAEFLEMRIAAKDLVIAGTPESIERYQRHKTLLVAFLKQAETSLEEPAMLQKIRTIESQINQHAALHLELQSAVTARESGKITDLNRRMATLGTALDSEAQDIATEFISQQNAAGPRIAAELQHTQSQVFWLALAAVALGAGLAVIITRSITAPLRQIAASLGAGADQTSAASSQVSAVSQSLAQGASEQAASLEETSASMEELSSMTKRNAEDSRDAKTTATETRTAANTGAGHMQALQTAMHAIKTASTDITKILKTIDEIAFQTNILALNAAVEAARAGEHGMGFAVVAEEVRALAQRSALAARETAEKIEDSVAKSQHGVRLTADVATSFQEIQSRIERLDHLVGSIASASGEQNQGINQITTAVAQMDQVTQTNAGTAEESAAAAEELNSQAISLRESVAHLEALTGNRHRSASSRAQPTAAPSVSNAASPARSAISHFPTAPRVRSTKTAPVETFFADAR